MSEYPKIKNALLKSGLPLESMVADCIEALSSKLAHPLINHGEYFFERNEADFPHSVDFQVTHDLDVENCDFLQIVFLIECKYCTQGTGWFFISNPEKDAGQEFFVENFFSKGKCNRKNFPVLVPPLNDKTIPLSGKGIEVYSNGERNEKKITGGIHQLMFACSSSLGRAFLKEEHMSKMYSDTRKIDIQNRSFHSLICPVLVTSANLYFMEKPTIKKVEKSEKVSDICSTGRLLTYSPKSPNYVRRYITENVFENIKPLLSTKLEETKAKTYLLEYSLLNPSRFYILNYQHIETFIEEYIKLASAMLSYACEKGQ